MAAKKPAKKAPAKKAPAKKKAAPKKAAAEKQDAANNVLSAEETATIVEAMRVGFEGRTSPNKLADQLAVIWRAINAGESYNDQVWAMWVTNHGKRQ